MSNGRFVVVVFGGVFGKTAVLSVRVSVEYFGGFKIVAAACCFEVYFLRHGRRL